MAAAAPFARYPRPYAVTPRAREIVIQCAPVGVKGGALKPVVIAKIPRSDDTYADHALANLVRDAFELADAVQQLLEFGHVDRDGVFTYAPPPRAGQDAIQRLRQVLQGVTPPPLLCNICRANV